MKIAVITAATHSIPRFRIDMIDEFVRRGCDVVVFGDEPHEVWDEFFEEHNVAYRTYPVSRNGMNPLSDLNTKRALKKLLIEEKPDKVWTYQVKPNIYGCIAAHEIGIKDIYVMMGGLGSVFRATDPKSRIIRAIVSAEYRLAMRYAKNVFFQNLEDVELFVKLGILNRDKVVLTRGSGVNVSTYSQAEFPARMRFLFVGRLVRGKGVLDYLDAARIVKKAHPEVGFDLVGPFDSNCPGGGERRARCAGGWHGRAYWWRRPCYGATRCGTGDGSCGETRSYVAQDNGHQDHSHQDDQAQIHYGNNIGASQDRRQPLDSCLLNAIPAGDSASERRISPLMRYDALGCDTRAL